MRGIIMRIGSLSVFGVFLAVTVIWGAVSSPRVGEAVPDDVAASLTGGSTNWACGQIQITNCFTVSQTCITAQVIASDNQGSNLKPPNCSVFCGSGSSCVEYPKNGNLSGCGGGDGGPLYRSAKLR